MIGRQLFERSAKSRFSSTLHCQMVVRVGMTLALLEKQTNLARAIAPPGALMWSRFRCFLKCDVVRLFGMQIALRFATQIGLLSGCSRGAQLFQPATAIESYADYQKHHCQCKQRSGSSIEGCVKHKCEKVMHPLRGTQVVTPLQVVNVRMRMRWLAGASN